MPKFRRSGVNFLKFWKNWNNWNNITRRQKVLLIAADFVYALTFAALIILAFAAVYNIGAPQTFGVLSAIFLGVFFIAIAVDIIFNNAIIRRISSANDYKEALKLLESGKIPDGDLYYYFNRSFRANIMYGNLQASEEDYNRALDTINLPERPLTGDEDYLSDSDKKKAVLARMLLSYSESYESPESPESSENPESYDSPESAESLESRESLYIDGILDRCDGVTKLKIYRNIKINYPEINIK
jgi:hypothetical protein